MHTTQEAVLVMLGALANSNHPALFVFTDGAEFIVLQPWGNCLRYLHTCSVASWAVQSRQCLQVYSSHHAFSIASPPAPMVITRPLVGA